MQFPSPKRQCLEITDKIYFIEHFNSRDQTDNFNLSEEKAQEYMDDVVRAITLNNIISPKDKLQLIDINYLDKTLNSILVELRCNCPSYPSRYYCPGGFPRFLDNLKTDYRPYLNNIYHLVSDLETDQMLICKLPEKNILSSVSFTIYPEYRKIATINSDNREYLQLIWEGIGIFVGHSQKIFRPSANEVLSQIPLLVFENNQYSQDSDENIDVDNQNENIFLIDVQQSQKIPSVGHRDVGKIKLYKYPKLSFS